MTEFDLIRRLHDLSPIPPALRSSIVSGIGDDAAVLKPRPGHVLLATTDLLAEGVHFDLRYMTYRQLGFRAAIANLSDIAAMGGVPRYALIALAIGRRTRPADVKALYAGLNEAFRAANTAVVGGDTSVSHDGLFVSMAVLGEAKPGEVLQRGGARPGDLLYVTGTLGDARAGGEILMAGTPRRAADRDRAHQFLIRRHIAPTARLREGRLLAQSQAASAAIDVSDGLAGDLRHICEESGVGVIVDVRRLPLSSALLSYARARHQHAAAYALAGGEDYELLFVVPPEGASRVNGWIRRGRLCATAIGRITERRLGLRCVRPDGTLAPLRIKGYEHRLGSTGKKGTS